MSETLYRVNSYNMSLDTKLKFDEMVKAGHLEPVKVCGEPKLTNDGAIAFEEGDCWCVYEHGWDDHDNPVLRVGACRRSGNPEDYGCWWQIDDADGDCKVHSVWSTRELAEAALAAREGKEPQV